MDNRANQLKDLPGEIIIEKLTDGWGPTHIEVVREFLRRLEYKLNTHIEILDIKQNTVHFVTHLSDINLRTMDDIPCLMLSGGTTTTWALSNITNAVREFWDKFSSP